MATRDQKRKEKKKKKRDQRKAESKKKETLSRPPKLRSVPSPHQELLTRQAPVAWDSEPVEDVAVFDEAVRDTLDSDSAKQVQSIREAFDLALAGRGDQSRLAVDEIPRSSPLSQWKVFLLGLIAWLKDEADEAERAWKRLDHSRRPSRIAISMWNARRSDSLTAKVPVADPQGEADRAAPWHTRVDDPLRQSAKRLHRVWYDRAAIRIAESGTKTRESIPDSLISPEKLEWIVEFAKKYRDFEPELVASLEQASLHRAAGQSYIDVFAIARDELPGPVHDPNNTLLNYVYELRYRDGIYSPRVSEAADCSLKQYLEVELPKNEALSKPVRNALASELHLREATEELNSGSGSPILGFLGPEYDKKLVRSHFKAATAAYPANRAAHQAYLRWIEDELEDRWTTAAQKKPLKAEMAKLMQAWSKGRPDDKEPRLWLLDYFIDAEKMDQAKPHVEWLANARVNDPKVRIARWRWTLLDAFRLCRRKAWLDQAAERLEESVPIWPAWLNQQWLPYLRASISLRAGDSGAYVKQRAAICDTADRKHLGVADSCMALAAAQLMRVPAADLKPLRAPVDAFVKNLSGVSKQELFDAAPFFWDLHRTDMLYPAYRMHGSKLASELNERLDADVQFVFKNIDDPQLHAAMYWISEHSIWTNSHDLRMPQYWTSELAHKTPAFAAVWANRGRKLYWLSSLDPDRDLTDFLRNSAPRQVDPFLSSWFAILADEMDERFAADDRRGGFFF